MNCTFTLLLFYYLMIGFQRLGFIRTYWRDVMSSASSWATGYRCITALWIFGNQKRSAFRSLWALECLHFQSEIPWEWGPHPNQNSRCIHNIHAWHFPLVAWCWWAKSIGVSGLGIFNQCMVPIDLNIHWVQKYKQAHQGAVMQRGEIPWGYQQSQDFHLKLCSMVLRKTPCLSPVSFTIQRVPATPPPKCQGHPESNLAQVSFNEFQATRATSRRWVDSP